MGEGEKAGSTRIPAAVQNMVLAPGLHKLVRRGKDKVIVLPYLMVSTVRHTGTENGRVIRAASPVLVSLTTVGTLSNEQQAHEV